MEFYLSKMSHFCAGLVYRVSQNTFDGAPMIAPIFANPEEWS